MVQEHDDVFCPPVDERVTVTRLETIRRPSLMSILDLHDFAQFG
jgi:hypothetical protein